MIWANHLMRASLSAMRTAAARIHADQSLSEVEDAVAPLADVFELQGEPELEAAERLYVPQPGQNATAIVLAASRGEELGELTAHRPKCMLPIAGEAVLAHIAGAYRAAGVKNITVIRGYCKQAVDFAEPPLCRQRRLRHHQRSLLAPPGFVRDPWSCVISYGDVALSQIHRTGAARDPRRLRDCGRYQLAREPKPRAPRGLRALLGPPVEAFLLLAYSTGRLHRRGPRLRRPRFPWSRLRTRPSRRPICHPRARSTASGWAY